MGARAVLLPGPMHPARAQRTTKYLPGAGSDMADAFAACFEQTVWQLMKKYAVHYHPSAN